MAEHAGGGNLRRDPIMDELRQRIHAHLIDELGPILYDKRLSEDDLRRRVQEQLQSALNQERAPLSAADKAQLIQDVSDDILGYGPIDRLLGLGFGFAEVGSITPLPQSGNPRPRLFRLTEDGAVINRMGFNNGGAARAVERLARRHGRPGVVGINIGANKDSTDRIADYATMARLMTPLASYLAVNVSSPNTPGLRALQDEGALGALLDAVIESAAGRPTDRIDPVLLDLLRLGAYQLLRTRVDAHAAVDTTVEQAGIEFDSARAGFVNGVLRTIAGKDEAAWVAELAPSAAADPIGHTAFTHAHPRWVAQSFADALGADAGELDAMLTSDDERPVVHLAARLGECDASGVGAQVLRHHQAQQVAGEEAQAPPRHLPDRRPTAPVRR